MIERINASGKPVVAIDVPSGVDASTGEVPGRGRARHASPSRSRAAKVGLAIAPGRFHAGSVQVAAIGLATREHEHALVPATVLADVPRKARASTKYRAGSVLVVGGSRGLTGAPMLAALAAFRADAGYVGVAAPESALPVIEARLLEAVKWPLPEDSAGRLLAARRRRRCSRPPSAPTRSRSARASAAATARASSSASCSSGSSCRSSSTRTRSGSSSRSRAPRRPCSRRTPASSRGCSARRPTRSTRTGSTRCGARPSIYGAVVLLKGADTLVAAPRERPARRELRAAVARDRRHAATCSPA